MASGYLRQDLRSKSSSHGRHCYTVDQCDLLACETFISLPHSCHFDAIQISCQLHHEESMLIHVKHSCYFRVLVYELAKQVCMMNLKQVALVELFSTEYYSVLIVIVINLVNLLDRSLLILGVLYRSASSLQSS